MSAAALIYVDFYLFAPNFAHILALFLNTELFLVLGFWLVKEHINGQNLKEWIYLNLHRRLTV